MIQLWDCLYGIVWGSVLFILFTESQSVTQGIKMEIWEIGKIKDFDEIEELKDSAKYRIIMTPLL